VAAPPDQRPRPEDPPRHGDRQVVLPQVQHVGPRRERDVGPVVDREQPPVPSAGGSEHLEQRQLLAGFQALLPQLDDVHPGGEHRVEERNQVTLAPPPVGAQVEPGGRQPLTHVRHGPIEPRVKLT
jgi:hypothetical protein